MTDTSGLNKSEINIKAMKADLDNHGGLYPPGEVRDMEYNKRLLSIYNDKSDPALKGEDDIARVGALDEETSSKMFEVYKKNYATTLLPEPKKKHTR